MKTASDTESSSGSSDDELKPSECASIISYERRFGVPGFEIETHDNQDAFWVPIALRT